jgi:hypothetical protein
MNIDERLKILKISWELHGQVEASYLNNHAKLGDDEWLKK